VTHADVAGNRPGAGTYADGYEQREAETFCFDPNTADSATLCRLGLSRWQVNDILRYRARGGVYMQATEFARVYRLTKEQYARLSPYIRIADRFRPAAELLPASAQKRANTRTDSTLTAKRPMKLRVGQQIALESCDTTQLKSVPGIGSYWAGRIVDYRERLGGYYDLSQLEELQGFPAEALPYLYLENGGKDTRRMNVNTLTLNQLHKHPYISFRQARDIIDYRRRHGRIDNLAQLALLPSFSPDDIERLSHYVEY
jgi:DNA uptake protein ComE-like DNA-binding protein